MHSYAHSTRTISLKIYPLLTITRALSGIQNSFNVLRIPKPTNYSRPTTNSPSLARDCPRDPQAGVGGVIKGWDQGCLGMSVGETRKLVIPAEEGYGANGESKRRISSLGVLPGCCKFWLNPTQGLVSYPAPVL